MGVTANKNVTVKLSLDRGQRFNVTPGYNLMTVDQTDLKVSDMHNFCLREVWQLIKIAFHNVSLTFCSGKILKPIDNLNLVILRWTYFP